MVLWPALILSVVTLNTKACELHHFNKKTALSDLKTNTSLIKELTLDMKAECATTCVKTDGCVSIFYDTMTKLCRLHSDHIKTSDANISPSAGFNYFELFCPGLDPLEAVVGTSVQRSGLANVKVVCDDPFFRFNGINTASCFDVVEWPSRGQCQQYHWVNQTSPFRVTSVGFTVVPGSKFIFEGKALPLGFVIKIRAISGTVELSLRLTPNGAISRLSKFGGIWIQPYDVDNSDALYPSGATFNIVLEVSETDIMGTITGYSVFTFSRNLPVGCENINDFEISGHVEVHKVTLDVQAP